MKNKTKIKQIIDSFWFVRMVKSIFSDRSKCPVCQINPRDKENPNSMCFNCFYKSLGKTTYKQKKGVK